MQATAQPILPTGQPERYVVMIGGLFGSEKITDISMEPYKLAVSVNARAIGRIKLNQRATYLLFDTEEDAWRVIDLVQGAKRRLPNGETVTLVASYGGPASSFLRGLDSLTVEKPTTLLCWLPTNEDEAIQLPPAFTAFNRLAPSSQPSQSNEVQPVSTSASSSASATPAMLAFAGASAPRYSQQPQHVPQAAFATALAFQQAAPVQPPSQTQSQAQVQAQAQAQHPSTMASESGIVKITRHHFFKTIEEDDLALLYLLDVNVNNIKLNNDQEGMLDLQALLDVSAGVITHVQFWSAYRPKQGSTIQRANILIGFGDEGETRRTILRRIPQLGQRVKQLLRDWNSSSGHWRGQLVPISRYGSAQGGSGGSAAGGSGSVNAGGSAR
ncbi:hypothetical protein JCM10296v2_005539 [Rhodotorula toruloides]